LFVQPAGPLLVVVPHDSIFLQFPSFKLLHTQKLLTQFPIFSQCVWFAGGTPATNDWPAPKLILPRPCIWSISLLNVFFISVFIYCYYQLGAQLPCPVSLQVALLEQPKPLVPSHSTQFVQAPVLFPLQDPVPPAWPFVQPLWAELVEGRIPPLILEKPPGKLPDGSLTNFSKSFWNFLSIVSWFSVINFCLEN